MKKYIYIALLSLIFFIGCSRLSEPFEKYNEGKMVFNDWSRNTIGAPAEILFHSTNGEFTLVEIVYPVGSVPEMSIEEFQKLVLGQARAVFGYTIPIRLGFLFNKSQNNLTALDKVSEETQKALLELSLERDFIQVSEKEWTENFKDYLYLGTWNYEIWYCKETKRLMRRKDKRYWKSSEPIDVKVKLAEPVAGGDATR
jgi:hypothetical protein